MNFLLDTHVFIWEVLEPNKLSQTVVNLIKNKNNKLFLSIVSIWEMQIKIGINKLYFDESLSTVIVKQKEINDLEILPINLNHIWQLAQLESHHKDPFDRMLIAQAIIESFSILSIDNIFQKYPVNIIW